MAASIAAYTSRITSEHQGLPNFAAVLSAILQPVADISQIIGGLPAGFDLDDAVGAQLDIVGLWVGISRELTEPLTGVYFSFDIAGLGFDEGTIMGPFDPTSGLVRLPDDAYRTLLRATIAANHWNGTIPSAYAIWATLFGASNTILIQDNGDMSMILALMSHEGDAVTVALFTSGLIRLKPAGVRLISVIPSIHGSPLFGFDIENGSIAGFDIGCIPTILSET